MELVVQKREIFGKKVKSLRDKDFIPAELYGHGIENLHLMVSVKDFMPVLESAGESTIINLKIRDKGSDAEFNVLIHDVKEDSLTDRVAHVDFYAVRMDEKIRASVPIQFTGESPAVKEKDGILVKAIQELEVEALPADLPYTIEADISAILDIGLSLHVKDLRLAEGVRALIDPESVIATVTEPTKEEEVKAPVAPEEVKVEGEEKREKKAEDKKKEVEAPQ